MDQIILKLVHKIINVQSNIPKRLWVLYQKEQVASVIAHCKKKPLYTGTMNNFQPSEPTKVASNIPENKFHSEDILLQDKVHKNFHKNTTNCSDILMAIWNIIYMKIKYYFQSNNSRHLKWQTGGVPKKSYSIALYSLLV